MKIHRKIALAATSALALLAISACTPAGFRTSVTRFQQLPPAMGESFAITTDNPRLAGGLEFGHYAGLVRDKLAAAGYRPAASAAEAQLKVTLDYSVDRGRERIQRTGYIDDPFWGGPYGYGWGGWRGGYFGPRFYPGFYDPFMFGPGFAGGREIYTVYTSELTMRIDRADGSRLFEGTAQAQSLSNRLTYLVPNLIEAMFSNFPGRSGETIRVTIAPEPRGR